MCTIIAKNKLIGKNYDSIVDLGMLFTNKRGQIKSSAVFPPEQPLEWVSTYGSITFSQSGKELPVCGMNENGLVVEQATLQSSAYPATEGKPALSSLEMTQYLLDTCGSVNEALGAMERAAVEPSSWPVHYVLFDAEGNKAIVEFRSKKLVSRRSITDALVVDNTEYHPKECLLNLETVEDVWDHLEQLKAENTVWSHVYDLADHKFYLRFGNSLEIVAIEPDRFDYSPDSTPMMLDIKELHSGWKEFSEADNRRLATAFYRNPAVSELMKLDQTDAMIDFIVNRSKNYDIVNGIVLRFLEGEQIKQLPTRESHKRYVLEYLASKFEAGKNYSEAQVNTLIDQWHTFGDYFVLRRELIDSGLMKRLPNGSKYWRE